MIVFPVRSIVELFAIGDLHLPGGAEKPMHVFGMHWKDHWQRIQENWRERVRPEDIVLIPGDISWAMHLEDAARDLKEIGDLPGAKVMIRGNHDYWWSSIKKVRELLPPSVYALQNDALRIGEYVFCGSRGWQIISQEPSDQKIWSREIMRMRMSLEAAKRQGGRIIAMIHYPPFNEKQEDSEFTELFSEFGVTDVYYGHLHGKSLRGAFHGMRQNIFYHQVSCDRLDFLLYSSST